MRLSHVICLLFAIATIALAAQPPASLPSRGIFEGAANSPGQSSAIDDAVQAQLHRLKITPSPLCSDAVFLRRVFLDTIGTLPTAAEARAFLSDTSSDKRSQLIDDLLERDEFAAFWAMKWSDLLRVKAEFPINLWPQAATGYYTWIHASIHNNKPFDLFARELLTASGSDFYAPESNFYRATQDRSPRGLASAVALTFMGVRTEKWPKSKLDEMSVFFAPVSYKTTSEWKEEIVYCDFSKISATQGVFPDGRKVTLRPNQDPREVFADWLLKPGNPYFARAAANRVWYWLLGRGIVNEPDDFRDDNPPSNPAMLAALEKELISHRYDLKHLFRVILNSQTYQRSSIAPENSRAALDNFAAGSIRRLDAEVLIDAICQITGTHEKYSSAIPEPFTFIPETSRSIALPDGSINSSFLELFGRSPRDTGQETERNNRISAAQSLHLLNSSHVQRKLENGPGLREIVGSANSRRDRITSLYLAILSRYPTAQELKTIDTYAASGVANERQVVIDVAWALINSNEFLFRH